MDRSRETSCEKNAAWVYTLSPLRRDPLQVTGSSCTTRAGCARVVHYLHGNAIPPSKSSTILVVPSLTTDIARITKDQPFTFTGVDFAGPLYVKEHGDMHKPYISVYTCAVSGAVHLDTVPDLSAEAFIRNFRRFAARRGLRSEVISDNGKTFKAASKKLTTLFKAPKMRRYLANHAVKWTFSLERAPWWTGFFKRTVQSVKRCLKKVLKSARVTTEELQRVLVEVEATLNARPLTFVSTEDLEEPLTPFHLMCGRRLCFLPDHCEETDISQVNVEDLRGRAACLETLKDYFWRRWRNGCLLELRNSHPIRTNLTQGALVGVGDMVIIHEDGLQRGLWKLGRVERLNINISEKTELCVVQWSSLPLSKGDQRC